MKPDLSKNYGRILVDFVNTADTDTATLSLFNHLQGYFSFSLDFYERVKTQFPSIEPIATGLGGDEKKLLETILKINEIIEVNNSCMF